MRVLGALSQEASDQPEKHLDADPAGAPGVAGTRVLLVEDNEINQQVALELLESAGVSVSLAEDGRQALEKLAAERFALVLMDIQMPGMDGLEATRRIRQDPALAELPIVAMTAHAMAGDREESLKAGMNDHVKKPIDPEELFAALARWIPEAQAGPPGPEAPPVASAADESPPSPEVPPLLDSELGLSRVRRNTTLYRKLLGDFVEKYAGLAETIRTGVHRGESQTTRRLVHTVKGVAGNIGAMRLYQCTIEVETCLGRMPRRCEALLEALDRIHGATIEAIQAYLGGDPSLVPAQPAPAEADMSPRVLLDRLDQWLDLLTQHDTRALESFSTLAPALATIAPEATEAVGHTLRKLDFREARRQAVTLRQTAAAWAAKEAAKDQDAALGSPGERPPVEPPGEGT